MNLGIRAILYSARKWKKTLLVFCLLLAITTLVLSGLAIADAQEEQAGKSGNHRGQLYCGTKPLYRWMDKRDTWLLQHAGIYIRGNAP